ncbi:MAG TPA: hypothetical protein VJV78_24255 [Polyangiales bacterium]|nr:hypothetical protein [Polyangiales bacterium]
MTALAKLLIGPLLAVDALTWIYIGHRIVSFPENHWGFDNRLLLPFFAIQLAAATALVRRLPRRLSITFVLIAALCVAASVALISTNALLPYELWLKRGMPARPF